MKLRTVKKVAIIGGGPSGLAAAKYLLAEEYFSHITVFEQRPTPGGVWNATPFAAIPSDFQVPCTAPSYEPERPILATTVNGLEIGPGPEFLSPIYPSLTTNIPHGLMAYNAFPFPKDGKIPLFPRHETVLDYLKSYAAPLGGVVRYSVQVLDVHPLERPGISQSERGGWSITVRDLVSGKEDTGVWDAVVIANGHFNDVFVPDIEGLRKWKGDVTHSKFFRGAKAYKGKKVVLIGNSASGTDLSDQLAPHCSSLLLSVHTPSPSLGSGIVELPEITRFLPSLLDSGSRSILFSNNHIEYDVDAVIFCTGYLYSIPFLHLPKDWSSLITTGARVKNTYQHIFYTPEPTLSIVGLPQRIIPFPDAESQGAVIARIYSGRLQLPSTEDMVEWEGERVNDRGDGRTFHLLPFPEDVRYMNDLYRWAERAEKRNGLMMEGEGLMPKWWGEEEWWVRERVPALKGAVRKLNREGLGKKIIKMEELGFDFEAWKSEKGKLDKSLL